MAEVQRPLLPTRLRAELGAAQRAYDEWVETRDSFFLEDETVASSQALASALRRFVSGAVVAGISEDDLRTTLGRRFAEAVGHGFYETALSLGASAGLEGDDESAEVRSIQHLSNPVDSSGESRGEEATTAPAGWHVDPLGEHSLRYWDGTEWTEHVHDHAAPDVHEAETVRRAPLDPAVVRLCSQACPDETPLKAIRCEHGAHNRGWLVATDQGLWWFATTVLSYGDRQAELSYDWTVETAGDLLPWSKHVLRIGGDQFQMSQASAREWQAFIREMRDAIAAREAAALAALVEQPGKSVADELRKMAELRDMGVLTESEFEAQKQRLLAGE